MKLKIRIEAQYICPKCHRKRSHAFEMKDDFADKFQIAPVVIACSACKNKLVDVGFFVEKEEE